MTELMYYDLKQVAGLAPSLATQIAREIGRRIVSGSYAPDDFIEDEGSLASRFQVGRSVVRDAMKMLAGKGLLEVRRGIGTRVLPRARWGLLDDDVLAWHQSAPPNRDVLRQLMAIRLMIEPKAAFWAAEQASEQDLVQLEAAARSMEKEQDSVEDFVMADALFHRTVLRATHNEFLIAMEGIIFAALLSSIRLTNTDPRENKNSIPFHTKVSQAIVSRHSNRAEQAMEALLADANRRLQDWFASN